MPAIREGTGYKEGKTAREIEQRTKKIPSDAFLWAAIVSMIGSLAMRYAGREKDSAFVGQWVPTLLILGVYNKLVKLHGSEGGRSEEQSQGFKGTKEEAASPKPSQTGA
jgi:hypothetical protein